MSYDTESEQSIVLVSAAFKAKREGELQSEVQIVISDVMFSAIPDTAIEIDLPRRTVVTDLKDGDKRHFVIDKDGKTTSIPQNDLQFAQDAIDHPRRTGYWSTLIPLGIVFAIGIWMVIRKR